MANLTLSVDNDLLKRARIRALERDTSLNALVRDYLENLAAESSGSPGMGEFLGWARSIHASSGSAGRTWKRDELHER